MDYRFQEDPGALVNLPRVKGKTLCAQVTDGELIVEFGPEFSARVNRSAISGAEEIADPRPEVYFPMGVSAAVDRLGRETLCVVTSHRGLVRVDFDHEVEGSGLPVSAPQSGAAPGGRGRVVVPSTQQTLLKYGLWILIAIVVIGLWTHSHGLWAILLLVLAIVARLVWAGIKQMQERNARQDAPVVERATIPLRSLILSLQNPSGFVSEVTQRRAVSA